MRKIAIAAVAVFACTVVTAAAGLYLWRGFQDYQTEIARAELATLRSQCVSDPTTSDLLGRCVASGAISSEQAAELIRNPIVPANNDPISAVAAACEDTLRRKLPLPSSYKRLAISEDEKAMSVSEWADGQLYMIRNNNLSTPEKAVTERAAMRMIERKMIEAKAQPTQINVHISYEAIKAGEPTRDFETCRIVKVPELP